MVRKHRLNRCVAALFGLGLLFSAAACGGGTTDEGFLAESATADATGSGAAEQGAAALAPDFTLSTLSGDAVRLSVRDTGRGIASEHLPHVFEPQFSTTTSGTGLGLAICKRLVESWGGGIELDSDVGKGTIVRIELEGGERSA